MHTREYTINTTRCNKLYTTARQGEQKVAARKIFKLTVCNTVSVVRSVYFVCNSTKLTGRVEQNWNCNTYPFRERRY